MSKSGYIYLAYCESQVLFKVGRSINPKQRMQTLSTDWGERWVLMHTVQVPDMSKWERYFLSLFANSACEDFPNREYFVMSLDDIMRFVRFPPVIDFLPSHVLTWEYEQPLRYDNFLRPMISPFMRDFTVGG